MPETESMQTEGRAAPASPAPSFADILCAIDGKEGGFSAVEHAAALAGTQGRRRAQEDTLKEQEQTLTRTRASGTSELVVEPGRAADVIKSAAAAADASLLVMGSRRLDGLRAMGSVSRRVVHQARCSVLLVPPETLAR